jgi:hypothetical protein
MNTNGPLKSEIEPDATISSAFLAVVPFNAAIEPLLCLIICAMFYLYFVLYKYFIFI